MSDVSGPPPFSVAVDRRDHALVVAPSGELDIATVGEVRAAFASATADVRTFVLDLAAVSFIDTSGISLVIEQQQRAEAAGHRFRIVRGTDEVQRLFEISGLLSRLPFAETVQAALADGVEAG